MKALRALIPALAACGLAVAIDAQAAGSTGTHDWSGAHRGAVSGGHYWSGGSGGHWSGGHRSGGHWGGRWVGYPHRHWYGGVSFYFGVPLFWPAYYWGGPYYYDYPRTVIYHEVERVPADVAPGTEVQPAAPGSPTQGPLYMNYCASAKAYYPKVTSCPEGWKFVEPAR